MNMTTLPATDPPALPDPVLERILVLGIRLAAPAMCRPGRTIDAAAKLLTPGLNALPRSCIPQVSYSVILQCPWIDANVASLTGNMWLLDVLGNKLATAPYNRPMQYDDTLLLDKVSGLGSVDVLDWWHNSDYVIGHDNPLRFASNGGHVAVLQWWLDSGRLGENVSDFERRGFDLLEPTRKGDMHVLEWWRQHVFKLSSDSLVAEDHKPKGSMYLDHAFAAVIWAALQAKHTDLVHWWIDVCRHFTEFSDQVMSALFASGDKELVAQYLDEYKHKAGYFAEPFPYAVFSGDIDFIEYCRDLCGAHHQKGMDEVPQDMCTFASCAGHVHVLDHLKAKGSLHPGMLACEVVDIGIASAFSAIVPERSSQDAISAGIANMSLLEMLVQLGRMDVLEWWASNFKVETKTHLKGALKGIVNLALANNRIALLDWIFAFINKTKLHHGSRGAESAASRGHLTAIQWYLDKIVWGSGISPQVQVQRMFHNALVAEKFDVAKWIIAQVGSPRAGGFDASDLCVVFEVLRESPSANVVEWCWKHARLLPFHYQTQVRFRLDDYDPTNDMFDFDEDDKGPTPCPSARDLWKYLCMIGAKATNAVGRKVTFFTTIDDAEDYYDVDSEPPTVELFRAWNGSPLFLERLLSIRDHRSGQPLLEAPLDLDAACQAGAGVAVLDWLYSLRNAQGHCKWSSNGYHHLKSNKDLTSLTWWDKMELPKGPRVYDTNDSDSDEDSEHDHDYDSYEDEDEDGIGGYGDFDDYSFGDNYGYDSYEDEGTDSDDVDTGNPDSPVAHDGAWTAGIIRQLMLIEQGNKGQQKDE